MSKSKHFSALIDEPDRGVPEQRAASTAKNRLARAVATLKKVARLPVDVEAKLRKQMPGLDFDVVLPSGAVLGASILYEPSAVLEQFQAA